MLREVVDTGVITKRFLVITKRFLVITPVSTAYL